MFCDICDFDKIIEEEKEKVIKFLDTLFKNFDILCNQNDSTKIQTVGKSYVAAAGLKAIESGKQGNL